MIDDETTTAIAVAWEDSLRRLARVTGGSADSAPDGAVLTLHTGVPIPNLNGVLSLTGDPADADLIAAVQAFDPTGPWSLTTRAAVSDDVRAAAAERGLTTIISHPMLTRIPQDKDAELRVPEGVVLRGTDPSGDDAYTEVVAAGFEAPADFVAPFGSAAVLGETGMEGFVVEFEGVPVAAAMGVRSGEVMAVVNVAVPPQYRRRGFGELATRAVLAHAVRSGSRIAFLHATPMGLPLYERLGFDVTERWTMILPASA